MSRPNRETRFQRHTRNPEQTDWRGGEPFYRNRPYLNMIERHRHSDKLLGCFTVHAEQNMELALGRFTDLR
eukprot:7197016-Alexandrium_andersonii.AAC.1